MKLDINCDLGEGEPLELTEALMRHITSANIGSEKTQECIALAKRYGVHVGAHPRHPIGRGDVEVSAEEFEKLLREQVNAFPEVHHIKLHGALYHATEKSTALAKCYVELVKREWPRAIIYAQCGKLVERIGKEFDVSVWGEAFADRRYQFDGTLVPRSAPEALITDVDAAVRQAIDLLCNLKPHTLCVHSDTPNSVAIAEALRRMVREWRPSSRE
ncbi:MAG TPA: LamB/YcsF family protein [Verrucomicrobiae bacterium]|nr:LamB/YcsF family protein [Verrucomicrobiae bacterium]